jgi:hypothetical protein
MSVKLKRSVYADMFGPTTALRNCILAGFAVLAAGSADAKDDEWRWRVFDREGEALLGMTDTEEATDNFGLPIFTCKGKSGNVSIEGEAKESLRVAMANVIRVDEIPWIQVMPETTPQTTTLDLLYSFVDGWRYKFDIREEHKWFERFKRDGVLEFKLGEATVHEEFKVGLENVGKFLDLCKSPPRSK